MFAHIAKACISSIDQWDACRRYGEKGQIAKERSRNPKCLLCEEKEERGNRHIPGSGECTECRG